MEVIATCVYCVTDDEYEVSPRWPSTVDCTFCERPFLVNALHGKVDSSCLDVDHQWTDYSTETEGVEICDRCESHRQFDLEERKGE